MRETSLSGMDAEDLEQECFMQLQKAIERYKPELGVPFASYYKIMIYGWRSNQSKVKARMQLAFGEDEMFRQIDERINIEEDIEMKLLIEEVLDAVKQLEQTERQIIEAYYLQNKKLVEIASELSIPHRTVDYKKSKALNKLRKMLSLHHQ